MMISTGHTEAIMDVVDAFGWENISIEDLETILYALSNYVQMRKLT